MVQDWLFNCLGSTVHYDPTVPAHSEELLPALPVQLRFCLDHQVPQVRQTQQSQIFSHCMSDLHCCSRLEKPIQNSAPRA